MISGLWWILWQQYQETEMINPIIAIFIILLLVFLSYSIREVVIPPEKRGVLLDDKGILFQQTSLGRMLGKIARKNIIAIDIEEAKHIKYVMISFMLSDSQYSNTFWLWKYWSKKFPLEGYLPIHTDDLEIEFDELWQWINSYWNQYG